MKKTMAALGLHAPGLSSLTGSLGLGFGAVAFLAAKYEADAWDFAISFNEELPDFLAAHLMCPRSWLDDGGGMSWGSILG